ncbi:hypothetical protein ACK3YN_08465 [Aeromonas caviae]
MVAANQGLKVIPYFRHAQTEGCTRGYKEGVRRAAVTLIVAQRRLTLPAYYHQINATTHSGSTLRSDVTFPSEVIFADNVERYVDLGTVRAHAVVTKAGRRLLVWVKVSSRTQHERHQQLASIEASSIEIDLSRLTLVRIPVNLNSDSGICEHHFRKVCGQGFCEQKLSFEGRHLFDSPNKPAAKRSAAVVDPGHWSMTVHLTSEFVL